MHLALPEIQATSDDLCQIEQIRAALLDVCLVDEDQNVEVMAYIHGALSDTPARLDFVAANRGDYEFTNGHAFLGPLTPLGEIRIVGSMFPERILREVRMSFNQYLTT